MKTIEWIWLLPVVPEQGPEFLEQSCVHVERPRVPYRSQPAPSRHSPQWDARAPLSYTDHTRCIGSVEHMRVHAPGHPNVREPVPGWDRPLRAGSDCQPLRQDRAAGVRIPALPWQHLVKERTRVGLITTTVKKITWGILTSICNQCIKFPYFNRTSFKMLVKCYCCQQNYYRIWNVKYRVLQEQLYNFGSFCKFIQRTYTVFWTVIM
jgi:hypothetical protein